jgi:hypothetical protein
MLDARLPALVDASGRTVLASLGYLILFLEDSLVAVPYDWKRLRVTGEAIPVYRRHGLPTVDRRRERLELEPARVPDVSLRARRGQGQSDTGPLTPIPVEHDLGLHGRRS